ncbi:MAG: right-handed parallel beta-helix repeat-containing protein [Fibrobacteres bacterium]|nr:right-handed parallel beta-helix repeat-containing protein [Fibrobacterota bacterium]
MHITPLRTSLLLASSAFLLAPAAHGATYWAAPAGKSANAGSKSAPLDLVSGIKKLAAGDSLLLEAGTYSIGYTEGAKNSLLCAVKATQAAPIVVRAPSGRAVFDFGFPEDTYVQDSYGISLTGSYWTFERIDVTRAGYQGTYVTGSHNTFDNCRFYNNRNSGVEVNKGGSNTLLHNVDAHDNYDPKKTGSMADGFAIKQTMGAGNRLVSCRSWNNSDDAYDTYDSPEFVVMDSCWAATSGWYHGDPKDSRSNTTMNGNGFKVGGLEQVQRNILRHCVAFGNKARGFDQNNNTGGVTLIHCTSFKNGSQNYSFGGPLAASEKNTFTNNISLSPGTADVFANATSTTNTWNSLAATASDFLSTDVSLALPARNDDGSIPASAFLRLTSASKLVDAGTKTNATFSGKGPDLGAFESGAISNTMDRGHGPLVRQVRGAVQWQVGPEEAGPATIRTISVNGSLADIRSVDLHEGLNTFGLGGLPKTGWIVVVRRGIAEAPIPYVNF